MRQLRTALVAYCAAASLSVYAFGQAQPHSTSISGVVVDSQGRSIFGAHISLVPQPPSKPVETTSDASGRFVFRSVEGGQYSLMIAASGFESVTKPVVLGQNGAQELTYTLRVASGQTTVNVQSGRESLTESTTDTGSLTPLRVMDLPQSVQSANRELLDEQKDFQFADALMYLPGVERASTNISGGIGNEVSMRGFILNTSDSYLRDGYKFFGVSRSDTADTEEVEVLKRASLRALWSGATGWRRQSDHEEADEQPVSFGNHDRRQLYLSPP